MPPSMTTPLRQPVHYWSAFFSILLALYLSPGVFDADILNTKLQPACFLTDTFSWLL